MVELGDLREGVLPIDLSEFIRQTIFYPILKLLALDAIWLVMAA
jgi:hypothetical protein